MRTRLLTAAAAVVLLVSSTAATTASAAVSPAQDALNIPRATWGWGDWCDTFPWWPGCS